MLLVVSIVLAVSLMVMSLHDDIVRMIHDTFLVVLFGRIIVKRAVKQQGCLMFDL